MIVSISPSLIETGGRGGRPLPVAIAGVEVRRPLPKRRRVRAGATLAIDMRHGVRRFGVKRAGLNMLIDRRRLGEPSQRRHGAVFADRLGQGTRWIWSTAPTARSVLRAEIRIPESPAILHDRPLRRRHCRSGANRSPAPLGASRERRRSFREGHRRNEWRATPHRSPPLRAVSCRRAFLQARQEGFEWITDRSNIARHIVPLLGRVASEAINSGASLYLTGSVLGHRQAATPG